MKSPALEKFKKTGSRNSRDTDDDFKKIEYRKTKTAADNSGYSETASQT